MSKANATKEWIKVPVRSNGFEMVGGNFILENEDVLISYQDFSEGGRADVFEALNIMLTGDTRQDDETALHDRTTDKWHILWGDHRKAYEKAFPDLKKCLAVYNKLKPKYNCEKWSSHE